MPNTERLRKLADHLLNGELGHKTFNFAYFNTIIPEEEFAIWDERGCGTNGCAIGECPIVWPGHWEFRFSDKKPVLKYGNTYDGISSGMEFFRLSINEFKALFVPYRHKYICYIGLELTDSKTTKEVVAQNILRFCDYHDNKSI